MLRQAGSYSLDITDSIIPDIGPASGGYKKHEKPGHWLTFLGTSGAGKTYLANRLWRWFNDRGNRYICPISTTNCVRDGALIKWSEFVEDCKPGGRSNVEALKDWWFLVVDDVASVRDPTRFAANLLYSLMEARRGKWTIFTANMDLESIAKEVDHRIASRFIRDNGRVVEVNVQDYATR